MISPTLEKGDLKIKPFHCKIYKISDSLLLEHYIATEEINLVNADDGETVLIADYEEASSLANLILALIKEEKADGQPDA